MRLEYFTVLKEVAKYQSISIASKHLYTSPQNISKTLRQFEKELNTSLLLRTKQGCFLTADGKNILSSAEIILNEIEAIQRKYSSKSISSVDNIENRNITVFISEAMHIIHTQMTYYLLKKYSSLKISTIQGEPAYFLTLDDFKNHFDENFEKCDLVLTIIDEQNYNNLNVFSNKYSIYFLHKERLHVEIGKKNHLSNQKSIPIRTLSKIPLISLRSEDNTTPNCIGYLEKLYNVKFNPSLTTNKPEIFKDIIVNGNHASLRGSLNWEPNDSTCLIPIQEKIYIEHIMLIPKNKNTNDPLIKAIVNYFKKSYPEAYLLF